MSIYIVTPAEWAVVCGAAGEEIVSSLGDEVDRLENQIRKIEPRISHVDIEAN